MIAFATVVFLLIVCTVISIVNLTNVRSQVETFYNGAYTVRGKASQIDSRFEQMQKSVFRAISNESSSITNEAISDAKQAATDIQSNLAGIKQLFTGDNQIITNVENALSDLTVHREEVLRLAGANQNTEAATYMENHNIPAIKKAQAEIDTLISAVNQQGDAMIENLNNTQAQSIISLIILGIFSIIVSVVFAGYITKSITNPVAQIEKAAEDLSKGKLDSEISYQSRDELGHLANSMRVSMQTLSVIINDENYLLSEIAKGNFNIKTKTEHAYVGAFRPLLMSLREMNTSLSSTMKQISQSADQVSAGSEQVSSGAQALSQGATEQASSTEELAATISEISSQVSSNAESALEASKRADNVGHEMSESNRKMQDMIAAMDEISNSSNEIAKIIKAIEDIAFQTNILALNAAVEAARAGAAGKGFAVVADEVRSLATKSQEASKNTAVLIETSLNAVKNGTRIADETANALMNAVTGAKEVTEIVTKISDASNLQAESIVQVTQGVDQISAVVQTNSATAEQSAAASEELSSQASVLKELVGRFQLKDNGMVSISTAAAAQNANQAEDDFFNQTAPFASTSKY